jgi:glucosyl-3-phosphoglycerate synthase
LSWIILLFILVIASVKAVTSNKDMTISVIIPAYNEEKTVGGVVKAVKSLSYVVEIIVVNDGSIDDTQRVAEKAGATVISHIKNQGKGAAIKTGFNNSKGDIIVFLDADLQRITPQQIDKMIQPILIGGAEVTKTKFKREAGRVTELTAKPLLNFFFPEIKFDQPLSGQFAAKRSFLNNIQLEDDYGVDVGIVLDADVLGMNVKEVDIGKINHTLSSLNELNLVATEVVRTIVDRANTYGRITMIDTIGKSIRMEILGLSLTTLGFFFVFFIRIRPSYLALYIGIAITIIGLIIAIYYLIKILKSSVKTVSKPEGKSRSLRSFFYMHSPIIVSGLIMFAILFTMLSSVHVDAGKISIEPASRNLIIWNQPLEVRGPYTVDSAVENEFTTIRSPQDAMNTLGLNYGDAIYVNNARYTLNQTLPGEDNIMRVPFAIRNTLGINIGDVILDSDLRNKFKDIYAMKALSVQGDGNLTINEGVLIEPASKNAKTVNIYLNKQKISTTTGILKNGIYSIYLNGKMYQTISIDPNKPNNNFYVYSGSNTIKIEIVGDDTSNNQFATSDRGMLFNFIF